MGILLSKSWWQLGDMVKFFEKTTLQQKTLNACFRLKKVDICRVEAFALPHVHGEHGR